MNISGNYLVGTMKRYEDPVEIPIVDHPEADEDWISFQGRDMKQFKFIGISVDYRDLTLVDFDPDNITEDDVTVYHAHSAHVKENGDLCSHATVEEWIELMNKHDPLEQYAKKRKKERREKRRQERKEEKDESNDE